jgi:hypothetical protein
MTKRGYAFLLLASLTVTNSWAYEIKSGLVKKVVVNSPAMSNRNVMVELEGVSAMCSISSNNESGYLNKVDAPDTFSLFVTTLLTAQASGRPVTVLTIQGAEGCRIDQVHLAG